MVQIVDIPDSPSLEAYEAFAHLAPAVQRLRSEAAPLVPSLRGRTVWMVNSTAAGGGVAEMLPKMVATLRELGVDTQWAVIETDRMAFFTLTKRIHNLIHGAGDPRLGEEDRLVYDAVSEENAAALGELVRPGDILVIHDPQPMGAGALLRKRFENPAIWRCHIGLDSRTPATDAAWEFLRPFAEPYDWSVFSAAEYIPDFVAGRSSVIHPALDPLGQKNRELSPHKLQGVLCNGRLAREVEPVLHPPYEAPAKRLSPSGEWVPADAGGEIGLLYRPIVTQISRWDRLKGFAPLLDGFARLKQRRPDGNGPELHRKRLSIVRLVLAGPDPESIADDPEGIEVLAELTERFLSLPPEIQKDVALLTLPMKSRVENALIVNALQRCSSIVVQNSLQEGFGLTVAEAMWKRTPVIGSRACGIRQQIRDGQDGRLVRDAEDPDEIAAVLDELLRDPMRRALLAASGQRRVWDDFLVFSQIRRWLHVLVDTVERAHSQV